jgi:sialidase-1
MRLRLRLWMSKLVFCFGMFAALAFSQNSAPPTLGRQETLFRSGEASYYCFRIPALVTTGKGTTLAFAEARKTNCEDWDEIDLVVKRTEDGGKTWSPARVLFHDGKRSVNQPAPVFDRQTGVLWLVFCKDNQQVFVSQSKDDGVTWSDAREITRETKDPGWKYVASGPGHGIQLSSGRLLVAAWGDASPGPVSWPPAWGEVEFTFAMYSDDHGGTWQRGRPMYENLTEEGMVAETADHRVYMALRSLHGKRRRAHAWSGDGGASWSRIQFDDGLPEPPAHGSILRTGAGRLLFVNPASDQERIRLTARITEDDGKTWPFSRVLYEGSSAYSDLALAADGTVLCLFEAEHYSKMILARFAVEELTQGRRRTAE